LTACCGREAGLGGILIQRFSREEVTVYYLYGSKPGVNKKLVATFDSQQQLLAYVRWAILQQNPDGSFKFEQGSPLVGYQQWIESAMLSTADDPTAVPHNPSPSML
jgi:hypothetical protein